jgi:hypothetical protein
LCEQGAVGRLAQCEFLDLAGRGFWQCSEHHGPGNLEAGQVIAAKATKSAAVALASTFNVT